MNMRFYLAAGSAAALLLGTLLGGCAVQRSRAAPSAVLAQPLAQASIPLPPVEDDALAQLLAGNFALASNDVATAAKHYLLAAKASGDANVAAAATRFALAAKDWPLARDALARWRALRPGDDGANQAEATLALADGRGDDAYAVLTRLVQDSNAEGWRLAGQVLLASPDEKVAGDVLERLVAGPPPLRPAEITVAISQLAFRLKRLPLARRLADDAVKKFGSGEAYAWAAQLAAEQGERSRAKTLFAEGVKREPKNLRLRAAYAALLVEGGDAAGAARALSKGPQDDYSYAARAAYAARADDQAQLRALYVELKALPEAERTKRAQVLGQIAELTGQKDAALGWYQRVAKDDAQWFDAQLRIAVLYEGAGKRDLALDLAHELQAQSADDPKRAGDAYMLEGELLARREQPDAAIAAYARGLQTLPDDTRLLYARALLTANLGRTADAERDLRRVLELKPDDIDAMNALGYTLADGNAKLEEALGFIERALKAKPEEPAVIDSFGWVQYRLGNLVEAEKALRRAFDKQPDAEIAAHLGEVLWQAGRQEEARRVWEQGRKKDRDNKVLLETLRRLGA